MSRPRLVFVTPVPPSPQSTSGFSARVHYFTAAAAERMEVTLILIRRPGAEHAAPDGATELVDRGIRLDAPRAPWDEPSVKGRALRALVQYPFDRLPYDCSPRTWPALKDALAAEQPDILAFSLPLLAHLVDHAPERT